MLLAQKAQKLNIFSHRNNNCGSFVFSSTDLLGQLLFLGFQLLKQVSALRGEEAQVFLQLIQLDQVILGRLLCESVQDRCGPDHGGRGGMVGAAATRALQTGKAEAGEVSSRAISNVRMIISRRE